jgi:hypothetical protein
METTVTARGGVIGVGELIVSSNTLPSEIPLLSFIVVKIKERDERFPVFAYVSTCIQLRMDGYGGNADEAINDMCKHCAEYFETLFTDEKCKKYAWRNLREMFHADEISIELQNAYNDVCLNLAERGEYMSVVKTLAAVIAEKDKVIERLRARDKRESDKEDVFVEVIQYKEAA